MKRESGILLPVSSLPSRYGIGCFSREAYEFVDWLKGTGQSYWQILPLGLNLDKPGKDNFLYADVASRGQVGQKDYPWERLDVVKDFESLK